MAEPLKIYGNEAAVLAPLIARPAATYSFPCELRGNALISTIFVTDIDGATITATWRDHNPLTNDLYTVAAHDPITANGYHRKFIAEATHGVSVLEITVAGGTPTFGVFVTANQLVGNFASPDSLQQVTGTISAVPYVGVPAVMQSTPGDLTDPGNTVVLASVAVSAGEEWQLRRLEGQCRAFGYFEVYVDAARVARSLSGPATENPIFMFDPFESASAGQTVEVRYTQSHGPIVDVSAFLFLTAVAV